ncbi:TPA: hypothetical protein I7726_22405 [Vibrio vulnificus]|nr:hypothetical protein [Vibrio vulnificus]
MSLSPKCFIFVLKDRIIVSDTKGTIGDNIVTPKENLEKILKLLGWSRKRLAREVYVELHDSDNPKDILNFEDKIKKEFQRATTKQEKFEFYLKIISTHRDFKKLNLVVPSYQSSNLLSNTIDEGLSKISKSISDDLLK